MLRVSTAIALLSLAACAAPPSDQPMFIGLGVGYAEAFRGDRPLWRSGFELRFPPMLTSQVVPALGAVVAEDRASFVYLAARLDLWLGERLVVTPNFGPGVFDGGDSLRLGGTLEFRSGIELAYRFPNETRLGLSFFHLSNAGFGVSNPGTEALVLTLALPLD